MCGTGVYHTDGLAPPLEEMNNDVFCQSYGVEFDFNLNERKQADSSADKHRAIRPISPFEYSQMFHLIDKLGLKLAESEFLHLLENGIPGWMSYALVTCI